MAERRFTRLKASLKDPKETREDVSRELRQSVSASDIRAVSIDDNYEAFVRALDLHHKWPQDDLLVKDGATIGLNVHHWSLDATFTCSGFARECVRHLCARESAVVFASGHLFGSVFDCFDPQKRSRTTSSSTSDCDLRPHVFASDGSDDDNNEERHLVCETSCLMNRMNGWLTLARNHNTCYLSFFKDRPKSQLIWSEEVTKAVLKVNTNVLQMDAHSIELSEEEIDEWIKAINDNRFDATRHLLAIKETTAEDLKRFQSDHSINIFSADSDLHARKTPLLARLRPTSAEEQTTDDDRVVRFVVHINKLELSSSERKSCGEVFFSKMALFDAKCGKISEEFRCDFGADGAREARDTGRGFCQQWLSCAKRAQFCCDLSQSRAEDLFLVVRVERTQSRPHLPHPHHHSEPFVWGARPLFRPDSSRDLECNPSFGPLYRLDANRLSDDYVTSALNNHHVMRNNTTVAGQLLIGVQWADPTSECQIDESLFPVTRVHPDRSPELLVQSLRPFSQPIRRFVHLLYVLPQSLKFDSQKVFTKARNLALEIQIRDSDAAEATPLPLLFGRPHDNHMFVTSALSAVSRHTVCPDFNEEVKIALPLHFSDKLHLLFSFHHISCKPKDCTRSAVGYAWLPLSSSRCPTTTTTLSVFASLPAHYLSCQWLGLGKGLSMPEMRFVGKDLFRVNIKLISSLMSSDNAIEVAMDCITRITSVNRQDSREISRAVALEHMARQHLKTTLVTTADVTELIRFSPVIFNQLLRLLVHSVNDDVITASLSAVVRLCDRLRAHKHVLHAFVDTVFRTCHLGDVHLHEQLVSATIQMLDSVDGEEESRVLLRNTWFVLRVLVKASIQHIFWSEGKGLTTDREIRFSRKHNQNILLMTERLSALIARHSRVEEAVLCNRSLASFLTRLLSFSDRSFVFSAIFSHLNALSSRDVVLSELRLTATAIVCAHEHHVLLNNPTPCPTPHWTLTAECWRQHFSISLLINEFKHSLSQSVRHVRQLAINALKTLLAKHAFDPRYHPLSPVVSLYAPALHSIIDQMCPPDGDHPHPHPRMGDLHNTSQHVRHNSLPVRFDALNTDEVKDVLLVFLFTCSHLTRAHVQRLAPERVERLLVVMETAVNTFQYKSSQTPSALRAKTLPNAAYNHVDNDLHHFLCRQNLCVQTALISLRSIATCLEAYPHQEGVRRRAVALLLTLLALPQSQHVLVHVFDNIRVFSFTFSDNFFETNSSFAKLIAKVVHFCDCALKAVRDSAVDLLFSLFSVNFKRTRFEVIVCVSRLASNDDNDNQLSNFRLALNRVESLARAHPPSEERLLQTVQRIKDILKATNRIRTESRSPYDNCELRLFLANSYAHTSWSLRRTWIENLSEVHARNNDWAEYAMCLTHVIAIVVQQLSSRGLQLFDALEHVRRVSRDLAIDDTAADEDWLEAEDSHVTVHSLEALVDDCVDALERAQLWELATHVLKVLVAYHENAFAHTRLVAIYQRIANMHARALEANESGKRVFDTYFRVAISGPQTQEFVYREPKVVSLAEMTAKLERLHPGATILSDCGGGADTGRPDSGIFVTHCLPVSESARNDFERNSGVNRFVYEQRLETESGLSSCVSNQHKRRVLLTTGHSFPYCLKRTPVVDRSETILDPIECAIDEMSARVQQLEHVLSKKNDVKHLQLVLQGSVQCQINCGPLAYSQAFLAPIDVAIDSSLDSRETRLRLLFEEFVILCERGLKENERLIKSDQLEYHVSLKTSFERLRSQLHVQLDNKRTSVQIFDVISGSSLA